MSLQDEINCKKTEIVVDSYPMSIGEVINLYKDGEIEVHPEFQRFYRWDNEQKSNLIESILLGIPIPPIFVAQRQTGKWDVIDGQQRLSTIFQFVKVLKDNNQKLIDALVLQKTKFLPSLNDVTWENENSFLPEQRIVFKREKLNFIIIKEVGDKDEAKYELFQRLNTGGTHLSPQEIRNCLLIMINKPIYEKLIELRETDNFKNCIPLTDLQQDEQYDLEYVVRNLVYRNVKLDQIDRSRNMDSFLTDEIEKIAKDNAYDIGREKSIFIKMYETLNKLFGEDSFKKFRNGKYSGTVLISAFEAIVPGLSENISFWSKNEEALKSHIRNIYEQEAYINATRRGIRPMDRMVQLIEFSKGWFLREDKID